MFKMNYPRFLVFGLLVLFCFAQASSLIPIMEKELNRSYAGLKNAGSVGKECRSRWSP